jgi:uncharacterized protein (TIGR03086 family)
MNPIEMFERAATDAALLAQSVRTEQMTAPTPCSEWDVAALLEHMAGGPAYLSAALEIESDPNLRWPDSAAIERCLAALRQPGALDRRCLSPAGFEWSLMEATAGTAMDQLIHTWDLAVAIGARRELDADAVAAVVAMILPDMPEVGRRAGLVGPAVTVGEGDSAQDILLGAMGRDPRR